MQVVIILLLFFISEALTTICYKSFAAFYNYSALMKGLFMIVSITYSFLNLTGRRKRILGFMVIMTVIFFVGQVFFNNGFGPNFFGNLIHFSRYLFVFSIALVYAKVFNPLASKKLYTVFDFIVVLNSVLIIIGVVFKIAMFKTYVERFGYNGLFLVPSISTYFYALALSYYSYLFVTQNRKKIHLALVCMVCFMVGTKALVLFFLLTAIHVFLKKKWYSNKYFLSGTGMVILLAFLLKQNVMSFFETLFKSTLIVYNKYDLITALTSYRNFRIRDNFVPIIEEKWGIINYLFGGTDFIASRIEFEIFDVFMFFGIIGGAIYLIYYFKFIFKYKQLVGFGKVQLIFLLLIALLAGTFFNNAPTAFYILLVLGSFNRVKS